MNILFCLLLKGEKKIPFLVSDSENFPPRHSRNLLNSFSSRNSFFLFSTHKWAFVFLSFIFLSRFSNWIWRSFLVIYHFNRNYFDAKESQSLHSNNKHPKKKQRINPEVKILNCILMDVFLFIILFVGIICELGPIKSRFFHENALTCKLCKTSLAAN